MPPQPDRVGSYWVRSRGLVPSQLSRPAPFPSGSLLALDEQRFRDLLDVLPAAVYTTDAQGRITFYNKAAVELWGCSPELGQSTWCGSWRLHWPGGRPMPHDQCPMAVALKEGR